MKKKQLFNKPELKKIRRELRKDGTTAEAILWLRLKNKQLNGFRFRRQYSIGNFIVDFYCPSVKLAIELDGAPHFSISGQNNDERRDELIKQKGIDILRFENKLVFDHLEEVIDLINKELKKQ